MQSLPTRNIWGMYPTTLWLEPKRVDEMQAPAAEFGQASQGAMLAQTIPATGQQQYVPVGQTTNEEIEERPEFMKAPAIEWGGIRMGAQVPIVVRPYDELEKRYGVMETNPFAGINLSPMMGGAFLGQVPLRMGQFEAAPMTEEEVASHQGYAMVNPLALAYTTGAYIRAGAPEWGRFPVMPPGVTYRVG